MKVATKKNTRIWTALFALGLALSAGSAQAENDDSGVGFSFASGIGIRDSEAGGGLAIGIDTRIHFNENFSLGPWLNISFADEIVALDFAANGRWEFDFLQDTSLLRDVRPFVQGGLGLAHSKRKGAKGDTEFLINMGFGAEVPVTDHVYVGSEVMFNTVPTVGAANSVHYTVQVATVRYKF